MILLWGMSGDEPLMSVLGSLRRRGTRYALLDQRDVLDTTVELTAGARLGGTISVGDRRIPLDEVTAVYLRQYDARKLPEVVEAGKQAEERVNSVESALWSWVEGTNARVVNRPTAMASNGSKPYQAAIIRAAGFKVPPTLITTDVEAAREFWARHGTIVYKSVSAERSIVSRLGPDDEGRLDDIASCPTQLQRHIPGQDVRVHVVGNDLFPAAVQSGADDYRYSRRQGLTTDMEHCELPPEVADRCRAVAAKLDFLLAGIDLRRTPEGEWYCFEVNPSPCFTYFQEKTCQPISEALTSLLIDGPRGRIYQ
jgi:hypothetical protein